MNYFLSVLFNLLLKPKVYKHDKEEKFDWFVQLHKYFMINPRFCKMKSRDKRIDLNY